MPSATDIGRSVIALAPKAAPGAAAAVLRSIANFAIDGLGPLPGARSAAGKLLRKKGTAEEAIDALIIQHVSMGSAQGFATNLGGFVTMLASMPANMAGLAVVETRMVAGIAHLRGYDVNDDRVRLAVLMTLLGRGAVDDLVAAGELPGGPLLVATAPAFDAKLEQTIAEKVVGGLTVGVSGKRALVLATKRIPLVGGGIGAVADGWGTASVGRYAKEQFVNRRPSAH